MMRTLAVLLAAALLLISAFTIVTFDAEATCEPAALNQGDDCP